MTNFENTLLNSLNNNLKLQLKVNDNSFKVILKWKVNNDIDITICESNPIILENEKSLLNIKFGD